MHMIDLLPSNKKKNNENMIESKSSIQGRKSYVRALFFLFSFIEQFFWNQSKMMTNKLGYDTWWIATVNLRFLLFIYFFFHYSILNVCFVPFFPFNGYLYLSYLHSTTDTRTPFIIIIIIIIISVVIFSFCLCSLSLLFPSSSSSFSS